jgi:hypothetical protein
MSAPRTLKLKCIFTVDSVPIGVGRFESTIHVSWTRRDSSGKWELLWRTESVERAGDVTAPGPFASAGDPAVCYFGLSVICSRTHQTAHFLAQKGEVEDWDRMIAIGYGLDRRNEGGSYICTSTRRSPENMMFWDEVDRVNAQMVIIVIEPNTWGVAGGSRDKKSIVRSLVSVERKAIKYGSKRC